MGAQDSRTGVFADEAVNQALSGVSIANQKGQASALDLKVHGPHDVVVAVIVRQCTKPLPKLIELLWQISVRLLRLPALFGVLAVL
jgi:hypothetical protein